MNEVTITITVRLPDGVTPDVSYGAATPARPAGPSAPPPAAVAPPPAAGGWVCPEHGTFKVVPAGTSKKTGKPYNAFTACGEQGCDQKPPRGSGPAQYVPAAPTGGEQFDDLPF